jgi:uncharacterized membrane protein
MRLILAVPIMIMTMISVIMTGISVTVVTVTVVIKDHYNHSSASSPPVHENHFKE